MTVETRPALDGIPIIASPHPSPMSADRGFFGSRPFSRANAALIDAGAEPRALDKYGRRALIYAGEKGPPPAVITRLLGGKSEPAKVVKTAEAKPWWRFW